MPSPVIVVVACYLLCVTSALAVEVKYNPPFLSIEADNEPLESVLLEVTKQTGGRVVGPQAVLNGLVSFKGSSDNVDKLMWKLLRHYNYTLAWSDDGKRIEEVRLMGKGDLVTLSPSSSDNTQLYESGSDTEAAAYISDYEPKPVLDDVVEDALTAEEKVIVETLEAEMLYQEVYDADENTDPTLNEIPDENITVEDVPE